MLESSGCVKPSVNYAMSIPSTVKIGGMTYNVLRVANMSRDSDRLGASCGNSQTIEVDDSLSDQMTRSTLIHEVLHQISFVYNAGLTEDQIKQMECGIFAFIVDNQHACKGLLEL